MRSLTGEVLRRVKVKILGENTYVQELGNQGGLGC